MRYNRLIIFCALLLIGASIAAQTAPVKDEVFQLNDQITKKREEIDTLRKQAEVYKKNIEVKQKQAATLESQVAIFEAQISHVDTEIAVTKKESEETELELLQIERELATRADEIMNTRSVLAIHVRKLDQVTVRSPIELLFSEQTLSKFLEQIQAIDLIQRDALQSLQRIEELASRLEGTHRAFSGKQETLDHLRDRLAVQRQQANEQRGLKDRLLVETKKTEELFQNLLRELRAEQQGIDVEITNLERTIRERLQKIDSQFQADGKVIFSWPVEPTRGISAYFHDPSYPFRNVFEHPAIDIRASQSTAIKAAAPGYVARAHDGGLGYSYVMIVHAGGYSTVYGHVSRILVKEDSYVDRGDVIALSGGAPGTAGAGRLTTGPHLHFEIRVNGIPVNPFEYLL
ncbi:peptidoglycan DD-metalloendopeptidase family protein [Candidatus Uhrbacteria bacterium]|nr:peptidoglycan DD-metalloendopeptidase family protein [Candidatus Uhrbacteria bacterium]